MPIARLAPWQFWGLLLLLYAFAAVYAASGELRGDEYVHFEQVQRFLHGDFRLMRDALTTIPGYHLLLAGLMRAVGEESLAAARLFSGLAGVAAVIAFYRLRRDAAASGPDRSDDYLATAQFIALPILLPFVFLVYTDVLSLATVLWAAWAAGRQRHVLAAVLLTAAIAVRQNNVLWILLLAMPLLLAAWQGRTASGAAARLRAPLAYALPGFAFVAYWIGNGSVSLSPAQAGMHPDFSPHVGNLFYFFFLGGLLFVLPGIDAWARFLRDLRARPWLVLIPLGVIALYALAFQVDHPYNLGEPVALRNWLLQRTQQSTAWHWGFGALALFGAIALLWQRWRTPAARLLWPVTVPFLCLSWLIEQRYTLIPFALLLAWREPSSRRIEAITLALWTIFAVLFFWGMISGRLYL